MRLGGLPFPVEGFSQAMTPFLSYESDVSLVVGVQRHRCWRCRHEGGVIVAVPRTSHRSELRPLIFVGADVAREDVIVRMRDNGSFFKSPWPIGALRLSPFVSATVPSVLTSRCSFCDAVWGPNHLRGPALSIAESVRDGEPRDGFAALDVVPLRGNPLKMLDDREFSSAVIARLSMEALLGSLGPTDVDRLFLPTWRGLEMQRVPVMNLDQRFTFAKTLPLVMRQRDAFGYALAHLDKGTDTPSPDHLVSLQTNTPLRGVNIYLRGRGLYHILGNYSTDANLRADAGNYRILSLSTDALKDIAEPWPSRSLSLDRIVSTPTYRQPAVLPVRNRQPSGVGVFAVPGETPTRFLMVQDLVRSFIDIDSYTPRLLVLCDDEASRVRHLQLLREMLTYGDYTFPTSVFSRISFEVLPNLSEFSIATLAPLFAPFDYIALVAPFSMESSWWTDLSYRARAIHRLGRIAKATDTRISVCVPIADASIKQQKTTDPYWDVFDVASFDFSIHGFPMSVNYAKRYDVAEERRLRIIGCFSYLSLEGPATQRWYEQSSSGRPVYRLISDPSLDAATKELDFLPANADVDDIFYRWQRRKFVRTREPRSPRTLIDAFASMRKSGLIIPLDLIFFLCKTDGCETQSGSRLYGLAEVQRSIDPIKGRIVIGVSSFGEFYNVKDDGGVEVRKRGVSSLVREYSTFALFLANLEREQVTA